MASLGHSEFYIRTSGCLQCDILQITMCTTSTHNKGKDIWVENTLLCELYHWRTNFMLCAVISIGRVFRSLLWRWRKMAALPLPVAILDDLISGSRSSKMATGSGRAAIFLHLHNRDRKTRPRFWMTSFPASPSWIQDGGGGNDVRRTSRRSWRRSTDVCPIHESCRSLTLLFSEIKKK